SFKCRVRESEEFTYRHHCSNLHIVNLCFADELFLFAHGDVNSAHAIMDFLEEFKAVSRLVHSTLLVKYMGMSLISTRMVYRDCKELVERVQNKVNDWLNKFLSFAGRLQLVHSVLSSMHVYWASCFILPARVILDIEQIMHGFLWCQGEMRRGKVEVSWDLVCLPKNKAGLGWCPLSLLMNMFSIRDIIRVGFQLSFKVADVTHNEAWNWPSEWNNRFHALTTLDAPNLDPNN
ncbi:hypothetical protein Tco_1486118, partial [Tanacetum coccineum]